MTPAEYLSALTIVWVSAISALVFYRLIVGTISLDGILSDGIGQAPSVGRLQALVITLMAAFGYALMEAEKGALIPVPEWAISVLAGSQGFYIFQKTPMAVDRRDHVA
ncbi:MAG: hypothetical protein ABW278_15710 [Steroidobacteraceae bacterium]